MSEEKDYVSKAIEAFVSELQDKGIITNKVEVENFLKGTAHVETLEIFERAFINAQCALAEGKPFDESTRISLILATLSKNNINTISKWPEGYEHHVLNPILEAAIHKVVPPRGNTIERPSRHTKIHGHQTRG